MHLLLIFPLAALYLATKSKIFLVALIIVVLPTFLRMLWVTVNHGGWGGSESIDGEG
jgi:hypothetical protein